MTGKKEEKKGSFHVLEMFLSYGSKKQRGKCEQALSAIPRSPWCSLRGEPCVTFDDEQNIWHKVLLSIVRQSNTNTGADTKINSNIITA